MRIFVIEARTVKDGALNLHRTLREPLIVGDRPTLVSFPSWRGGEDECARFLLPAISISRFHVYIRVPRQGITGVIALARSCYGIPVPSSSFGQISCMIAPEFGHLPPSPLLLLRVRLRCILMILVNSRARRYIHPPRFDRFTFFSTFLSRIFILNDSNNFSS